MYNEEDPPLLYIQGDNRGNLFNVMALLRGVGVGDFILFRFVSHLSRFIFVVS
jgi:hypothetical protein